MIDGLDPARSHDPLHLSEFGIVLSYPMNNRRDAVYHLSALPRIAPWLFQYWRNASKNRCKRSPHLWRNARSMTR
jgi:hypothetical protein